ncbi:MAG: hypothetical protein WCJ30_09830 [Deltaproteobacteria bacterium]
MLFRRFVNATWLCVVLVAQGCAAGSVDTPDVSRDAADATTSMDTAPGDTTQPRDTPIVDTPTPVDTGRDVTDVRDVPVVTDTGVRYCPDVCRSDAECQTICPTAATGYHYCCQLGAGGGSCSQRASACTTTDPVGDLGAACSVDSECYVGRANCCFTIGSAGTCGCHGVLGCNPPMLCM